MSGVTYYQRNREVILNRVKRYYEYDKERLREKAKDKYRNKKKNMEKTDIIIYLKKRNKN